MCTSNQNRIINPFQKHPDYNCFGCSSTNSFGLKMNFIETEHGLECSWQPPSYFQGWINVLHGGIQASLMDEIASWVVFVKLGVSGVTSELKVKYKKAVEMTNKPITIKAQLREMQRNIAIIDCFLHDHESKLCATAECKYFTFNEEVSKESYLYPGIDAFYDASKK
jgi:uncharacterized protein (TIGR00369 family)